MAPGAGKPGVAEGPALTRARALLIRGDTRAARAAATEALASDPDRAAAQALLENTRTDPLALLTAGCVLIVIASAATVALFLRH